MIIIKSKQGKKVEVPSWFYIDMNFDAILKKADKFSEIAVSEESFSYKDALSFFELIL